MNLDDISELEPEIIHLSPEDQRQIAEAILSPPEPTEALRKAAERYRTLFEGRTTDHREDKTH
jgi:uncharacterized protein (DUF1778 family)